MHSLVDTQDEQDYHKQHLTLHTLSAATKQIGSMPLYSGRAQSAQLAQGPQGSIVTWNEDEKTRLSLTVPAPGQAVGQPQTLGQAVAPQILTWQLTRSAGSASVASIWNVACLTSDPGCSKQLFSSFLGPQGTWSAPLALPMVPPIWGGGIYPYVLKTNSHGQGVFLQAQASGPFLNTRVQVFASVLKPPSLPLPSGPQPAAAQQ